MRVRPARAPHWSVAEVAQYLAAPVDAALAASQVEVHGISLNTSDTAPGDLFAALAGEHAHGARYADAALASGAVAVLTDRAGAEQITADVPVIVVENPRSVVASLAAELYDQPAESMEMIGVTGTQGKTTTTYLAQSAVGVERSAVVGTIGTVINGVPAHSSLTTPEAPALQALFAVMREEQVRTCAMEVSSHSLVQGRVDGFLFDTAVFLNLGRDHLDFHLDIEDYFAAKAKLFTPEHARRAVINLDDEHGRRLAASTTLPVTTFSSTGRPADWQAVNIRPQRLHSEFVVIGPDGGQTPITVQLPGAFNVSNALAVIAGLAATHDVTDIAEGLSRSPGVPGRMERVDEGQDFAAIVDYAHKPDAVKAVLEALRPTTPGRLIVVLGAGGDRDRGKRSLMGQIAAERSDVLIVTDDNPRSEDPALIRREILDGARTGYAEVIEIGPRREAIAAAVDLARLGDTVVVAGKGHESGQHIGTVVHPFDDRVVLRELLGAAQRGETL